MNPIALMVASRVLDMVAAGFERETILGSISDMQKAGKTPEEIAAALGQMADDAIAKAQAATDKAP